MQRRLGRILVAAELHRRPNVAQQPPFTPPDVVVVLPDGVCVRRKCKPLEHAPVGRLLPLVAVEDERQTQRVQVVQRVNGVGRRLLADRPQQR